MIAGNNKNRHIVFLPELFKVSGKLFVLFGSTFIGKVACDKNVLRTVFNRLAHECVHHTVGFITKACEHTLVSVHSVTVNIADGFSAVGMNVACKGNLQRIVGLFIDRAGAQCKARKRHESGKKNAECFFECFHCVRAPFDFLSYICFILA